MKKTINGFLIAFALLLVASCTKVDNYPGPDAGFQGRLIDKTTGANFLTETSGIQVKLEELSWSATPTPQFIPSKPDGTFEDSKLFKGHYRVTITQGPFWPADTTQVDINGMTTKDFQLTPYLKIKNLTYSLTGTTLTMKFNLDAPITQKLPNILDIKPFVNTTQYVGSGATVSQYSDPNQININSAWSATIAATTYTLTVTNLKSGRTFYARVGARVDDSYKKYNYSEVITVNVP
jgi:hypothetical protein